MAPFVDHEVSCNVELLSQGNHFRIEILVYAGVIGWSVSVLLTVCPCCAAEGLKFQQDTPLLEPNRERERTQRILGNCREWHPFRRGFRPPEQAEMDSLDIDTRTDIYSLGVMLYELKT
jgi:serine/threonine protein kinase